MEVEGCTFQPKLESKQAQSSFEYSGMSENKDQFYDRLTKPNSNLRNLEIQYKKEEVKDCTFKPKINSNAKVNSKIEAYERLYKDREKRKRDQAKAIHQLNTNKENQYSFKPERETKNRDKDFGLDQDSSNRYEKLYENSKYKEEKMQQLKAVYHKEEMSKCRKEISRPMSAHLYSQDEEGRRENLYIQKEENDKKKLDLIDRINREDGCSFTPRVNHLANMSMVRGTVLDRNQNFLERRHRSKKRI